MQLSKRGKEPVEQPLFRVSERSRRTPRPRRIPVGFFRNPRPPRRNRDESSRNPRPTRTVSPPMPPEITAEPSPRAQFPPLPFLPRNPAFRSGTAAPLRLRDTKPTLAADVRHSSPRPESSKIVRLRRQPPEKRICRIIRKPPPRQPAEPCGNGKTRPSRLSRKPRRTEPRKARCVSRQAPDGFTPYSVRPLAPQSGRSATARPNPISASQRPGHARRCRAPPNRSMRSRFRRILPRPLRPPQAAAGKRP